MSQEEDESNNNEHYREATDIFDNSIQSQNSEENNTLLRERNPETNETANTSTRGQSREVRSNRGITVQDWSLHLRQRCYRAIIRYYNSNYFYSITLAILLFITSMLTLNYYIQIEYVLDETQKRISCGVILLIVAASIIPYIFLSLLIKGITSYIQHKKLMFSYFLYSINHISDHVAIFIVTLVFLIVSTANNFKFKLLNQLDLKINTHDIYLVILFADILMAVISLFVCNIAFNFNRDTLIDRMLVVFRIDYFIKLLKAIRNHEKRKNRGVIIEKDNDLWEYGFPWIDCSKDFKSYKSREIEKKKELYFITKTYKIAPSLRDWIYMEFRKQPENILYSKKSNQIIDFESQKIPKNLKSIIDTSKFEVKFASDLEKYFNDRKKFDSFCILNNFEKTTPFTVELMKNLIKRNLSEKRYIQLSLDQINGALTRIKNSICGLIIILIAVYAIILSYENHTVILAVVSTFFGTGFAFQSSVKNAIDSIIFLLCIHPYDVGDRILIYLDNVQHNMVVQEMNVFSTIFARFDGTQTYIPHSALACKQIVNISRSGYMLDTHKLQVNCGLEEAILNALSSDLSSFVLSRTEDFTGFLMVNIADIENPNKMHLNIMVQYRRNWHDFYGYLALKGEFLKQIKHFMDTNHINYVLPSLPVLRA